MKTTRLELFLVFLMAVLAYGYFDSHQDWNTYSRLAFVKAVVEEQRFEIDSYHAGELETGDKAIVNGHYYSDKALGASLLGVIAYAPIHWISGLFAINIPTELFVRLVTFLGISIPCASLAPVFYALVKPIVGQVIPALFLTAIACFGTPVFKYSTYYYGHALAAVVLLLVLLVWHWQERSQNFSARMFILTGFLMGWLIIIEYPTALLVLLAGLYILQVLRMNQRLWTWQPYVWMALGFVVPVAIQLGYNQFVFGGLFSSGYANESTEVFREAHASGLMGFHAIDWMYLYYMTFQVTMGLFWQVPVFLLSIPGWYYMLKAPRYQWLGLTTLQMVLLYFLLFSGYYMWYGGLSFTPRHLIPILPLLVLPLAFLPNKAWGVLALLGSVSILQMLAAAASRWNGIVELLEAMLSTKFSGAYVGSVLYNVILPNFFQGRLLENLGHSLLGLNGLASLLPLLLIEAVLVTVVIYTAAPRTVRAL